MKEGSYYIFQSGTIKRKDNTVRLCIEKDGKTIQRDLPIERIRDLYIFGEVNLNSKLLNFLGQNKVIVHLFNYYGYYTGSFYPREQYVSGALLVNQVGHYTDPDKRLTLAKCFVTGEYENIYRNLRYYKGRGKDVSQAIDMINRLYSHVKYCKNIPELMGMEGNIKKTYYSTWQNIINTGIDFERRERRPPKNMINTLISFTNTLIYTKVLSEIYKTSLNPTISYLHEPSEKRFSLALDIAEIFKPLLADRLIFSILNKKIISENDFEKGVDNICMKEKAVQKITEELNKRCKTTISHKDLGRDISYLYLMRLECYKIIKHLMGEQEYVPFKIWW